MQKAAISFHSSRWSAFRRGGAGLAVALLFAGAWIGSAAPASAQVIERGVQGGILGAIVGGAVDGGKGVGRGAAIGAGVGLAAGAVEQSNRERYYAAPPPPPPPPPGYYGRPPMAPYGGLVAKTQVALNRLGYNPGPVDGVMGPGTSNAIRNYQYAWGLPPTGAPSYPLLNHMRAHGG